ncbi:hypothetical protein AMS68_001160 [Peltaster fructicola]|uniref:ferric-chelate reductase (NADPH) n=1 Tax=Peltaster fructicola TaxID=286661 RepID=A0A6H0XLP9_9PEZI|nr:hypothetical protein AMS68_001160 [Peltaster fructicola]
MVKMSYKFIFEMTDAEKQDRRRLLDQYGSIAQLSVVFPLLALQGFFLITWLQARSRRQRIDAEPSSPVRKSLHRHGNLLGSTSTMFRQVSWWCGDGVSVFGLELGTKGEVCAAAVWTSWLLLLSFLQTGDDYLHLTKRFGIVAASQLPFHYLLAVKSPYSPLQWLTQASHETLNAVHQILGRIVTLLMYLHVILYLNFYVRFNLLATKLQEAYVICGVAAIISFTIIGTSSLVAVRRWSYRIFLAIHITLSIAILPLLYFHVQHLRVYIYETVAVLILNVGLRTLATRSYSTAKVSVIPGTQLIDISVEVSSKDAAARWLPGQHAYVSLPEQGIKSALAKNPFTLSSVPAIDGILRFVARIQSGNTAALAKAASSGKQVHRLLVEGPYGVVSHSDRLLSYDRVLLIAGGIGATFIMPLYRQLLADLSPSKGSYRRQKISAVWVARSPADVAWALPKDDRAGFLERLRIHITRSEESGLLQDAEPELYGKPALESEDQGIEMEERSNLLSKEEPATDRTELPLYAGRPAISHLVKQVFSTSADERVAIVVCGPRALGQAVRKEVSHYVYAGRTVWFWDESFAL